MCDEISTPVGTSAGANLSALADFVAGNAIPIGIAVAADVALAFVLTHLIVVIVCTTVVLLAATVGRVVLARLLLRVMGSLVAPVGLDKLRPARPVRVRVRRPVPALPRAMQRSIAGARLRAILAPSAAAPIQSPAAAPVRERAAIMARPYYTIDALDALEGVVIGREEMVRR